MPADLDVLLRREPVRQALAELESRDAVPRLHGRDPGLWSSDPAAQAAIGERLGWLAAASGAPQWAARVSELAAGARADGLSQVVLAGMGGSSLAAEVFAAAYDPARLTVLDSTHPAVVRGALDEADRDRTLVLVASKSGTTAETDAFTARAETRFDAGRQLVAITDPGTPLARRAAERGYRDVLENPADIGGRFSALSLFGAAPAALVGADIERLWQGATRMLEACGPGLLAGDNPAAQLAAFIGGLARNGRDKLTLLAPPELSALCDWIEQLIAESTGKQGRGVIPVVGEPAGPPEVYGEDRAFVALCPRGESPVDLDGLAAAAQPVLALDVGGPEDLGAELVRWEIATALLGALLGVNPFDEPDVADAKANTRAVLEQLAAGEPLASPEPAAAEDAAVERLLASLRPGDYVSLQLYLPPSAALAARCDPLRSQLRAEHGVATTLGWGPRLLHSAGQLHKGGPDSVAVLQLVDTAAQELAIPDRDYGFATFLRAQSLGDLRALNDRGRRAVQLGVEGPEGVPAVLERLATAARRSVGGH